MNGPYLGEDEDCHDRHSHAHGVSLCWLRLGHQDEHEGPCEMCWEDGDTDVVLTWP